MSSTTGSKTPLAEPARTAAVVTHGHPEAIGRALERLEQVAASSGVQIVYPEDEAEKHSREADGDLAAADLVVVLGGDGTMLRALKRTLGHGPPVIGVNYGAVGFLTSISADEIEQGLERAFRGEYVVADLPTLDVDARGERHVAVNDVVVASSVVGRMIELGWAIGGEELGALACDGVICSTPSGSTGYNLSNGGPVLVWGLDAMALTFVAPHSLHARPLVVPRSRDLEVTNASANGAVAVLADGHKVGELASGDAATIRLADQRSLLATLPDATFFRRYRETFAS
jgi:NAD+ kinase